MDWELGFLPLHPQLISNTLRSGRDGDASVPIPGQELVLSFPQGQCSFGGRSAALCTWNYPLGISHGTHTTAELRIFGEEKDWNSTLLKAVSSISCFLLTLFDGFNSPAQQHPTTWRANIRSTVGWGGGYREQETSRATEESVAELRLYCKCSQIPDYP